MKIAKDDEQAKGTTSGKLLKSNKIDKRAKHGKHGKRKNHKKFSDKRLMNTVKLDKTEELNDLAGTSDIQFDQANDLSSVESPLKIHQNIVSNTERRNTKQIGKIINKTDIIKDEEMVENDLSAIDRDAQKDEQVINYSKNVVKEIVRDGKVIRIVKVIKDGKMIRTEKISKLKKLKKNDNMEKNVAFVDINKADKDGVAGTSHDIIRVRNISKSDKNRRFPKTNSFEREKTLESDKSVSTRKSKKISATIDKMGERTAHKHVKTQKRRYGKSQKHWGEYASLSDPKTEVTDIRGIFPLEKRDLFIDISKMFGQEEQTIPQESLNIDSDIITQTIDMMDNANKVTEVVSNYTATSQSRGIRKAIPVALLSPEIIASIKESEKKIKPTFMKPIINTSDFCLGKPKKIQHINKQVALAGLSKAVVGMLRVTGFDECSESCLQMFVDGVEEYMKSLFEKLDCVMATENLDKHKVIDLTTLERAYQNLTGSSVLQLHNYFKFDVIERHREEVRKFRSTCEEYINWKDETADVKEEHSSMIETFSSTTTDANVNDSESMASSVRDSNYTYEKPIVSASTADESNINTQYILCPSPLS